MSRLQRISFDRASQVTVAAMAPRDAVDVYRAPVDVMALCDGVCDLGAVRWRSGMALRDASAGYRAIHDEVMALRDGAVRDTDAGPATPLMNGH